MCTNRKNKRLKHCYFLEVPSINYHKTPQRCGIGCAFFTQRHYFIEYFPRRLEDLNRNDSKFTRDCTGTTFGLFVWVAKVPTGTQRSDKPRHRFAYRRTGPIFISMWIMRKVLLKGEKFNKFECFYNLIWLLRISFSITSLYRILLNYKTRCEIYSLFYSHSHYPCWKILIF